MTEDEAKEKWCPHVRLVVGEPTLGACNENRPSHTGYNCIASGCMMWNWDRIYSHSRGKYCNSDSHGACGIKNRHTTDR